MAELRVEKDAFMGSGARFEEGSPNGHPRDSENH